MTRLNGTSRLAFLDRSVECKRFRVQPVAETFINCAKRDPLLHKGSRIVCHSNLELCNPPGTVRKGILSYFALSPLPRALD